mmetsp:Transcript_109524/g.189500  ORF Transcript_109524/g.189500 Transcript_109524/m.189500 type:complete len:310 (-) Transcript_109524:64-993(-)
MADESDEVPPPLPEPTGIIGLSAKMIRSKTAEVAGQSLSFVKDKSEVVKEKLRESERVQKGVEFVQNKTREVMENERVQKGLEIAKDKAKVVQEKASEVSAKVAEKTKQGIEIAKDKTRAVREGAGSVWEKGRGSVTRVRASVSNLAWRGSARDTLDIAAREEQWKGIKIQGAEEITVPARNEHTCCYHVSKGATLRWTFRVKDHDIGFGVRMRVQQWGGAREDEVLAVERYDNSDTISGSWVADEDRTMVLVFDNRYSRLRSKTVAYLTGTEKPPSFEETSAEASAEAPETANASASAPSSAEGAPAL